MTWFVPPTSTISYAEPALQRSAFVCTVVGVAFGGQAPSILDPLVKVVGSGAPQASDPICFAKTPVLRLPELVV